MYGGGEGTNGKTGTRGAKGEKGTKGVKGTKERKGARSIASNIIFYSCCFSHLSISLGPSQVHLSIGRNSHFKISGSVNIELPENSLSEINKFSKLHQCEDIYV